MEKFHIDQERGIVDAIYQDRATRRHNAEQRRAVRERRKASRRKGKAA